jgi:hypothetical protein
MRTTDAPETNSPMQQARNEAAERARLSAEAQAVMDSSRPTPSQAEVDAIKRGEMDHDDKEEVDNPSMPPLAEQHARIEAARGGGAPRRRRSADAADDSALYRTRDAQAERSSGERPAAPSPASADSVAGTAARSSGDRR